MLRSIYASMRSQANHGPDFWQLIENCAALIVWTYMLEYMLANANNENANDKMKCSFSVQHCSSAFVASGGCNGLFHS